MASRSSLLKLGKAIAIDGIVFFETAEIEPVAGELDSQTARAFILQHAARLRDQHLGLSQIALAACSRSSSIRHAGPEEVAQPAGEIVGSQGLTFRR